MRTALLLAACLAVGAPVAAQSPSQVASPAASPVVGPSPNIAALAWTAIASDGAHPQAREDHTLTVDPDGRAAYLFGGRDADGMAFGDLWRLDLDTDTWQKLRPVGDKPKSRFGHTATWVPGVGMVVWAGQRGTTFFDDLWAFDPVASRWDRVRSDGSRPRARYGSCASLGPDGRLWVSHGFTHDLGRFDDTWAFDFDRDRWSDETPRGDVPGRRCLHDCTFTPDGRLLLYGGQTTGVPALGDLWSRTVDSRWTKAPRPEPAARHLYAWAVSGPSAFVFGGGGLDGDPLDDLWQLDLTTLAWQELHPDGDGPAARSGATLIADDARSRLILFGGLAGDKAFHDLWVLSTPSESPTSSPVATPGSVTAASPVSPEGSRP